MAVRRISAYKHMAILGNILYRWRLQDLSAWDI